MSFGRRSAYGKQISRAKKSLSQTARAAPYLFPAYIELKTTKDDYRHAENQHKKAKDRWKKINNPDQ